MISMGLRSDWVFGLSIFGLSGRNLYFFQIHVFASYWIPNSFPNMRGRELLHKRRRTKAKINRTRRSFWSLALISGRKDFLCPLSAIELHSSVCGALPSFLGLSFLLCFTELLFSVQKGSTRTEHISVGIKMSFFAQNFNLGQCDMQILAKSLPLHLL